MCPSFSSENDGFVLSSITKKRDKKEITYEKKHEN